MLLLNRAIEELEKEKQDRDEEKIRYLGEKLPPLQLSGLSLGELQVICMWGCNGATVLVQRPNKCLMPF